MSALRRLFYAPPVNAAVRGVLRPFRAWVPDSLHIPVNGQFSVGTPNGPILVEANPTSFVAKTLFWGGHAAFEPHVSRAFDALLPSAGTFLDIGANIGWHSLAAARAYPDLSIHAFEPLPAAAHFLDRNVKLNQFDSIQVHTVAVSDSVGVAQFAGPVNRKFAYLPHQLAGTGRLEDEASDAPTINVELSTLDHVVESMSITSVDVIKMDTEGTEARVIDGASRTLERDRPFIVCEVLPSRDQSAVQRRLAALNYSALRLTNDGVVPVDDLQHDGSQSNDCLFFPVEREEELRRLMGSV